MRKQGNGTPGSLPEPGVTCLSSLLLVFVFAPRAFLWVFQLFSLHKNQHSIFQFNPETLDEELFIYLFIY